MGDFEKATAEVMKLSTRPTNDQLLKLYGLYKQATEGDVTGKKPGAGPQRTQEIRSLGSLKRPRRRISKRPVRYLSEIPLKIASF